uniref:Uncharacterized protein n=1 Tax=Anopheles culicifacies TaxID=139723 RepID=A0A182MIV1_9DIPT
MPHPDQVSLYSASSSSNSTMKFLLVTAVICSALALTLGVPVPSANPDPAPEPAAQPKTDIELMKIPLDGDKTRSARTQLARAKVAPSGDRARAHMYAGTHLIL